MLTRDGSLAPNAASPAAVSRTTSTQPVLKRSAARTPPEQEHRPNILLITTDDQNAYDMRWMPKTRRLLGGSGMTFTSALSPHPLCCPARAAILTGQYAQNNGVRHNHGRYGGYKRLHVRDTVASWLDEAGYRTAFVGKFLNEYDAPYPRPPGWTIWNPMLKNWYSYFGTTFYTPEPGDARYSVDVVGDRTADYIRRLAPGRQPFFIWSSQVAPHAEPIGPGRWGPPPVPPRYRGGLDSAIAPALSGPVLNVPGAAAGGLVGDSGMWSRAYIQRYLAKRIGTLRAVDAAVARALRALEAVGELRNTYVFFASDNGYLLGEHGLVGKNVLYKESLEIPMLVRGPGVPRGSRSSVPVTLVDLAPTFMRIAGARAGARQDGTSLLPVLHGNQVSWRDTQLVQTGSRRLNSVFPGWAYRGVRTDRYTFARDIGSGRIVLFDRRRDPNELHDVAGVPAYAAIRHELARRTRLLSTCAGDLCNRRFGDPGEPSQLSER